MRADLELPKTSDVELLECVDAHFRAVVDAENVHDYVRLLTSTLLAANNVTADVVQKRCMTMSSLTNYSIRSNYCDVKSVICGALRTFGVVVESDDLDVIFEDNVPALYVVKDAIKPSLPTSLARVFNIDVDALFAPNLDLYMTINANAAVELQTFAVDVTNSCEFNYAVAVGARCGYVVAKVVQLDTKSMLVLQVSGDASTARPLLVNDVPVTSSAMLERYRASCAGLDYNRGGLMNNEQQ